MQIINEMDRHQQTEWHGWASTNRMAWLGINKQNDMVGP